MGWWKINSVEKGGIGLDVVGTLLNATPGKDHSENYYNGDAPADIIQYAAQQIAKLLKTTTKAQLKGVLLPKFSRSLKAPAPEIQAIVEDAWINIEMIYSYDWKRPPYDEEKEAIVNFVLNEL